MSRKNLRSTFQAPVALVESASDADSFIVVGDLRIAQGNARLSTVLGSCVAVCLWSREQTLGGMNHYLRPTARQDDLSYLGGNVAISAMIEQLAAHGCRPRQLIAKVFGGSHAAQRGWNIGAENVLVAWSELRRAGIPIVATDVGGDYGRLLHFDVASGRVLVRRLETMRAGGRP